MELSPATDVDDIPRPSRRKSGRVHKAPEHLSPFNIIPGAKRKRTVIANPTDDQQSSDELEEAENEDEVSSDGEADEEEIRETRRKTQRKTPNKSKPSAKRAKTAANAINLPIRPAANKAKKTSKSRLLVNADAAEVGGLYGEIFSNEETLDGVASAWLGRFHRHESNGLTEIVNLVLRCAGCGIEVTSVDIEDPDNATSRLGEIQEEFQKDAPSDYPINSKGKNAVDFKRSLTEFFRLLYLTVASTNALFREDQLLSENIQVWIAALSAAPSRPFRHTATVVALTITSALCEIGKGLAEKRATTLRQIEGEEKNKRPNKGRINDWKKEEGATAQRITQLEAMIKDWFDTVFVHRYRDIDPKIRLDCVVHLGDWIMTYPDQFFDGQHLRYLGWVLSDSAPGSRIEAVKQLQRFFKDNSKLGGLRQFTERFRPRLVEIATRDNDVAARIAALELLNILRAKGLLEPNDIDIIGKLIFDSEPRVRKVVVDFFAASVEETFESKIEDLGGLETVEEAFPIENMDDVGTPRVAWLRIKCLAELVQSYDADEDSTASFPHTTGDLHDIYNTAGTESRLSLAAQSLIEKIPDLKKWDVIAGYLLFDHSSIIGQSDDLATQIQQAYNLEDKEEVILLDVLNASVKLRLAEVTENVAGSKIKKTKAQLRELHEEQEEAAQKLAITIPKLLRKFGASPESASVVLRLEHVLNLDLFEQLRQDSTTYTALLEDINKQFLSHENQSVLVEARTALLHAKSFEDLEEITDGKLSALWDDTTHALATLCRGEDMSDRGTIHPSALAIIASTVLRISNLASISDCIEPLETERRPTSDQQRRKQRANMDPVVPIDALIASVGRGVPTAGLDVNRNSVEDLLTSKACESALFYFLWRIRDIQSSGFAAVSSSNLETLSDRKEAFMSRLREVIQHRRAADDVRLMAAGALLDLHVSFTTLRNAVEGDVAGNEASYEVLETLMKPIDAATQAQILRVFAAAESDFAKKAGKVLNFTAADKVDEVEVEDAATEGAREDPRDRVSMSPASSVASSDDEADDDDGEASTSRAAARQHAVLVAEQRLCDFAAKCVLAIVAGVVDAGSEVEDAIASGGIARKARKARNAGSKLQKRLVRNAGKLGQNFKMVVGSLERGGAVAAAKGRKKGKTTAAPAAKNPEPVVSDGEDEEEGGVEDDEIVDEELDVDANVRSQAESARGHEDDIEDSIMGD